MCANLDTVSYSDAFARLAAVPLNTNALTNSTLHQLDTLTVTVTPPCDTRGSFNTALHSLPRRYNAQRSSTSGELM